MAFQSLPVGSMPVAGGAPIVSAEEDAMDLDAEVTIAVKRTFEQMQKGSSESPEEGRLEKRARLEEGPSSVAAISKQYFQQWAPSGETAKENPFQLIEIKVEVAAGQYYEFRIPRFALFKLSSHFKKVFSSDMAETKSLSMIWKGWGSKPYIHPQAARYLAEFAHYSAHIIERDQCRTLAQVKGEFPDEFEVIFTDIARLCAYFEINDLSEELSDFFCSELIGDPKGKISQDQFIPLFHKYFQWAMTFQQQNLFKTFLSEFSKSDDVRIFVYQALIDLFEADYAECSEEEKQSCQRFVQECFGVVISSFRKFFQKRFSSKEWDHACECFIKLFPRFDFDPRIADELLRCSFPTINTELRPNPSFFQLFCLYYVQGELASEKERIALSKPSRWPDINALKNFELLRHVFAKRSLPDRIAALESFLEKKHPQNQFALRELGMLYSASDGDRAIQTLSHALELKADDPEALMERGECYMRKGCLDQALEDFNAYLRFYPGHPLVLYRKGECLRQQGELDQAIVSLNACLTVASKSAGALIARGMCYRSKGQIDEALKDLQAAIKLDEDLLCVSLIADCYARKGEIDLAHEYIDRALRLDPDDPPALQFKAWLNERNK